MFRIRFAVAVSLILLISIGFLGYFIPFNSLTLDVAEANQKKNLSEQNNALLRKIISTLRLLNSLKDQVARLEDKKLIASQFNGGDDDIHILNNSIDFQKLSSSELLRYIENREKMFESVYEKVNKQNSFDSIPVIYPVEDSFVISRGYGMALDPFTFKKKRHYGIDLVSKKEAMIIATASGVVTRLENHPIWGIRLEIEHGNGFRTVYSHLGSAFIKKGNKVKKGEQIGKMGMSGLSTGVHLHYEVIMNGAHINPNKIMFPSLKSDGLYLFSKK